MGFETRGVLGRTGLEVSRLGIGSSYGVPAAAVEKAYREHGVNFFYWGSVRRREMGDALRSLARTDRERIVIALQSYDRYGFLLPRFLERGLRSLAIDRADLLILGWHNSEIPPRLLDAAREQRARGKVRFLAMSGHNRPFFGDLARRGSSDIDAIMVRYNAAHRGAETDVFPHLPAEPRFGMMAYTATCWGRLLDARRMPPGESPLSASHCYRFALSHPAVDLCMTGPRTAAEMEEACRALAAGPLSPDEILRARRIGDHVRGRK